MANQLLTISQITREALMVLRNNLVFVRSISKDYDSQFAKTGAKIGSTVNVRKPPRYVVSSGPALQVQNATETYVPVSISYQHHVDIEFSSSDLALNIDDFSERFLMPAMVALANKVDLTALQDCYKSVYNMIGTPGTTPATSKVVLQCGQRLDEEAAPTDEKRSLIITPATQTELVDVIKGYFNPQSQISDVFRRGRIASNTLGFDWAMSQNLPTHTYGTSTSGANPTTNGAQSGTGGTSDASTGFNLTVNAITGTITKGTVITLSGVYAVNPQSRQSTGALRQFVVTSDVADGATTIPIFPTPVFSGAFQNVYSSTSNIASGATVTLPNSTGSLVHAQNMAFHKDAFTLATADLVLPGGVDMAARENIDGLSLRLVRQFDINSDRFPCRIDILYGVSTLYPELATRLTS